MERSGFGPHAEIKGGRTIELPETINMNRFLNQGEAFEEYRLVSVPNLISMNSQSGQFIAFCAVNGHWWMVDDKSVTTVPYDAVFDENFPPTSVPPKGLETASLLIQT
jgi:hypothetical protein